MENTRIRVQGLSDEEMLDQLLKRKGVFEQGERKESGIVEYISPCGDIRGIIVQKEDSTQQQPKIAIFTIRVYPEEDDLFFVPE